jgi:hypothetical protein
MTDDPTFRPPRTGITDGRLPGDFQSRYPCSAWLQISAELAGILIFIATAMSFLFIIGYDVVGRDASYQGTTAYFFDFQRQRPFLVWVCVGLSGVVGGATFSLKWLYHSVAKNMWNRDRILWRLTVPTISGVLALFLGFMIVSGLVPFLNGRSFNNFYVALGFGFFTGYFSDNVLGALQRLALQLFGTVDTSPHGTDRHSPAGDE